jgi:hypothetical protein
MANLRADGDPRGLRDGFAHTLVPISFGYLPASGIARASSRVQPMSVSSNSTLPSPTLSSWA